MIQAARASARVACRSVVADATAGPALLLRGGAAPSLMRPRTPLVVVFSGAAQPRRGLASAVAATTLDGDGRVDDEGAREVRAEAPKKQQPAETETKAPRRRRQLRERPAPITLTDRAAAHLINLLASKPEKVGVRLGVKRRGCNGMSYTLKYADEAPKGDEEVTVQAVQQDEGVNAMPASAAVEGGGGKAGEEKTSAGGGGGGVGVGGDVGGGVGGGGGGARLFVDPMATLYIAGTVMDWEETELAAEFTFRNPNAKGECGCGESFNV